MNKHNHMRSFSLFVMLLAVLLATQSSTPGIASANPHAVTALNIYLPVVMDQSSQQSVFGVTLFSLDAAGGLMQFTDGGTGWTRQRFTWSMIEPSQGNRLWDPWTEQQLLNVAASHITPIMIIDGTPDWALKDGYSCGAVSQDKFSALASFAYDLVKRYSEPPFNVRYWELWNEPDAFGTLGCWGDPTDRDSYGGYYYGQMMKAVSPSIKLADPQAQVLVGGLLLDCNPDPNFPQPPPKDCTPSKFLKGILESGAGPYFDGVSFHAYDYTTGTGTGIYGNLNWQSMSNTTGPVLIAKTNYVRALLAQYGFSQKYLLNTETAVFWGPNQDDPPCALDAPADVELTKVYYVIQTYAAAMAEGLKANIWYAALGGRCAALLNPDLSPKPAYNAYEFTLKELRDAIFVRQITEYPQVMGYEYLVDGKTLWVLWPLDGGSHTIALPMLPSEVNRIGMDGSPVQEANNNPLTIDLAPRFIEFGP